MDTTQSKRKQNQQLSAAAKTAAAAALREALKAGSAAEHLSHKHYCKKESYQIHILWSQRAKDPVLLNLSLKTTLPPPTPLKKDQNCFT